LFEQTLFENGKVKFVIFVNSENLMETYGKILLIAIPFFLGLILIEKIYGVLVKKDYTPLMDMFSSLLSGITNIVKDVLGLSISILTYEWLAGKIGFFQIETTWLSVAIAFVVLDFQAYWVHRWAHEINIFWNKHVVHHSSEEFNLPCALRQSISQFFNLFTFFLIPAALIGVPAEVIAIIAPVHLFLQFWYHTRHIGKMGFLEHIIVTPSHHRVHHAMNHEYLDKNYAAIFIFWDKWFGTFQAELEDIPPVYGITRPAHTWNPIKINFQHLWLLFLDAWRTKSWSDKLKIWFKPTGWRPSDVESRYPVSKIDDVYHFEKFNPNPPKIAQWWSMFQLVVMILLGLYFFGNLAQIGVPGIYWYGFYIFVSVYALAEFADGNIRAPWYEALRFCTGMVIIYFQNGWYGIDSFFEGSTYLLIGYMVISLLFVSLINVRQNVFVREKA
jgi:alkylglycerol monooxygenase